MVPESVTEDTVVILVQNVHQTATTVNVIIRYIVFHVYLDITVISVTRPAQSIVRTPVTEMVRVHVMMGMEAILVNPAHQTVMELVVMISYIV